MKNKIIILTGPGGSGKSTLATLLNRKYGYLLIDGDQLDTEFFPNGGQSLPKNKERLKKAHDKIFRETKKEFLLNKSVVIDYIIFGEYQSFLDKFKSEFEDSLYVRVLLPNEKENILRDEKRQCWTTGSERVKAVREEFLNLKEYIGEENFVDTSYQTPEESVKSLLDNII